jgi:hypothetical protein
VAGSTKYKVFFHAGDELGLKTRVSRGEAWLDKGGLHIHGKSELLIANDELRSAELFRLHGLGRVIRVEHRRGRLFLSVVRFMIGQFATINFFKTGKLHQELVAMTNAQKSGRDLPQL